MGTNKKTPQLPRHWCRFFTPEYASIYCNHPTNLVDGISNVTCEHVDIATCDLAEEKDLNSEEET